MLKWAYPSLTNDFALLAAGYSQHMSINYLWPGIYLTVDIYYLVCDFTQRSKTVFTHT